MRNSTRKEAEKIVSKLNIDEKLKMFAGHAAVERIGLKEYRFGGEAAHGLQARSGQGESYGPTKSTSFTQPIGMAASFDKELIREAGDVVGTEVRAFHNIHNKGIGTTRWAPTVDLCRDPRWGRNEEGYGEDPFLTGKMAGAYIEGMQNEYNSDGSELKPGERGDRIRVGANLKHFYANNVEYRRCYDSFDVSEKVKYDYELEPYRYCIEESHAEGIMTAYNGINGVTGMLNHEVQDILKDKWGMKHAVCDGGAFQQVVNFHHDFETHAETFAESVKAGVDNMLDDPRAVHEAAVEAFNKGLISESEIDKSLVCMFESRIRLGLFDDTDPFDGLNESSIGTQWATDVSRKMAEESNVLLKNNGILPISKNDDYVLIGPCADTWYQDWYCGMPMYQTTLKQGIEEVTGREIRTESALNIIRLKSGQKYVGATDSEKPQLILVEKVEDAVEFTHTSWGSGSNYLYSKLHNRYVRLNEDGSFTLETEVPFFWYIMESLTIAPAKGAKVLDEPHNANMIEFDKYWDGSEEDIIIYGFGARPVFIKDNVLMSNPIEKKKGSLEGQNVADRYNNNDAEPAVFSVEIVENGYEKAKKLAKSADKVILALGCNPVVNAKEEIDRKSIEMIPYQNELFKEVLSVNKNVIVVLMTNYPYAINEINENAAAVIMNATGSQDMGYGLASALFGESSLAGRLPMTWYLSDDDLVDMKDYDLINNPRTYRYFDKPVLYPFGYGMTYASFGYESIEVDVKKDNSLHICVIISRDNCENESENGPQGSDEVIQVYLKRVSPSKTVHPIRKLIGFERVHNVMPGENIIVSFDVKPTDISIYMEELKEKIVEPGEYVIYAGKNALDEAVSTKITVL